MLHTMEGQLDNLKPRKRKNNSDARSARKVSVPGRRRTKGSKTRPAAESSSATDNCRRPVDPVESISRIICECHLSAGVRRCTGSPELGGLEGKENELWTGQDAGRANSVQDKQEPECMDCEEASKIVFLDDDSNEVLPVEQFFGNLDTVQDFPQRPPAASPCSHREHRRRHYYAPEDSDEEELAQYDRAGT